MAAVTLRNEERLGLGVAIGLHVALVVVLALQPHERVPVTPPERVTVNLAPDVGMKAAAPSPVRESRAATAPTLSSEPAPASPAPEPLPQTQLPPEPVSPVPARPQPRPRAQPEPRPQPKPQPKPQPERRAETAPAKPKPERKAEAAPAKPQPKPQRRTEAAQSKPPQSKPAPASKQPSRATPAKSAAKPAASPRGGASRLGDNFLAGAGESSTSSETRVPASEIGASAKASLVQAIARKIKPHWEPPNGPEVEKITTVLAFQLKPDGSLAGRPRIVQQTGVNDINRAQAQRHGEQAIRAVQLAAPFDLPSEYYAAWKNISAFSFDWKLSQ